MEPTERRREAQRQLREQILDAARELFAEAGYDAVTMRGVAERIGYSPTTIYLHFQDKEALVRELCTVDFLALAQAFPTLADLADPLARILGIGRAFLTFGLEHPNHYRMLFMTPHPPVPPEARQIRRGSLEEDAWAMLVDAVAEAQAKGLIARSHGRPSAVAQQFFAGIHGVLALHLARRDDPWIDWEPAQKAGEQMIQALLRGYAAAPGKGKR